MNHWGKNDTNHEYQDSNDSASTPEREKLESTKWNPTSKPLLGSKANSYEYSSPHKLAACFNASNEITCVVLGERENGRATQAILMEALKHAASLWGLLYSWEFAFEPDRGLDAGFHVVDSSFSRSGVEAESFESWYSWFNHALGSSGHKKKRAPKKETRAHSLFRPA